MRRAHQRFEARGEVFYFLFDSNQPDQLHITVRHGATPVEAIQTLFEGITVWNEQRKRFETVAALRGIYWVRVPEDQGVLIISCFRTGED